MRRTLGSMGAWFLATGLAILVSWLGVRSVLLAAVPDRASPMSAAEARGVSERTPASSASPTGTASDQARATTSPEPSQTPSPTKSAQVEGALPATPTPNASGWTEAPDGRGGIALLKTVQTQGGTARIRFTENDVRVIATEPATGFDVSFGQQAPAVATVTFTSPEHVSKITAFWERGARAQVSETPAG